MITTQPLEYWHGPTYEKPTHGDFYVSFAGADIMEACTWDEISPSGASMLPYEIGSGVEDNGFVYSTHYFYDQPNSEVPADKIGYSMDLVWYVFATMFITALSSFNVWHHFCYLMDL